MIEADRLGQYRTGAASGSPPSYLAKRGRATLGVFGAGSQAEMQVALHPRGAAGDRGRRRLLARRPSGARSSRSDSASRRPRRARTQRRRTSSSRSRPRATRCFAATGCAPGALVCAAGANRPQARELDNAVLERAAFVCCDSIEDATIESGDLIEPVAQGVLDWLEVHELAEVVSRRGPGTAVGRRHRRLQVERDRRAGTSRSAPSPSSVPASSASGASSSRGARAVERLVCAATMSSPTRVDHLGPLEHARDLALGAAVADVGVVEDVVEAAAALVLADDVGGDALLARLGRRTGTRTDSAS